MPASIATCFDDPIQVYELLTVTFGDKPSPTAAIVVLRHVAAHNATDDSEIQRVVANQFYVDDLNDSQRSIEGTLRLKQNLTVALDRGHFKIRKWLSNKSDVSDTEYYPKDDIATALATRWNLVEDTLSVKDVTLNECTPTMSSECCQESSSDQICCFRSSGLLILTGALRLVQTVTCFTCGKV